MTVKFEAIPFPPQSLATTADLPSRGPCTPCRRAVTGPGRNGTFGAAFLARAQIGLGRIDEASASLEAAERIRAAPSPSAISYRLSLAWILAQSGRSADAVRRFDETVVRMARGELALAIKHANASVIEFQVADSPPPGHITLLVRDNGIGFAPGADTQGKGLSGMKRRAAAGGVGLTVQSSPAGTCIQIDIPDLRVSQTLPTAIGSTT